MDIRQKPSRLVMEVLATNKAAKFEFGSIVDARKFQQRISGAISRMMSSKVYNDYWTYLDELRVLREKKVVYVGMPDTLPNIYGNVKVTIVD